MLDIKFIRENKDLISAGAEKKHIKFDVDALISVDDKRKDLLTSIEKKRAEQNEVSDKIVKISDDGEKQTMICTIQLALCLSNILLMIPK